jgi:transcriptional regulator with XRE-family HTH domain
MGHRENLRYYLKQKGLSQKEAGELLGYKPAMMSRYLNDLDWNWDFISSLIKSFPDIDLNSVLKEDPATNDAALASKKDLDSLIIIEEIEQKLSSLKISLTQK